MELAKYLLPSHSIEITVSVRDENNRTSDLILRSIIEKGLVDDVFKIVAPVYQGKIYNFHIDEVVSITFASPDAISKDLYSLKCKIVDRHFIDNLSTLTLNIIGSPSKVQRRQAFRVNTYNTYSFRFREMDYELITKDISSTGMLALSTIQLTRNSVFEILFDANIKSKNAVDHDYNESKKFKIRCKVIDSIPQVEIRRYLNRIRFEGLTDQESKHLIQYLYAKQTEIMHLDPNASEKINSYFEHENDDFIDSYSKEYKRLQVMSLIGMVSLFISFVMLLFSRPKRMYVLDYFFDFYRPQVWKSDYLLGSLVIAFSVVVLSLIGLALNFNELKKNNGTIHWSLLFMIIISLAIIIFIYSVATINNLPLL